MLGKLWVCIWKVLGVCWKIEGYVLGKGFVGGREVMQCVVEMWSECVGKVVGVCWKSDGYASRSEGCYGKMMEGFLVGR